VNHLERFEALCIDCADDPLGLARWWQGLIGGEVEADGDSGGAVLQAPGYPELGFYPVPEAKTLKNRLHIDLRASDFDAAVAAAVAHGATPAPDVYSGDHWQVLRDPQGNEFCILRPYP
jgi:Glyoxalase-like domain